MFKTLFCVVFSCSVLGGAAMADPIPGSIDSISTPVIAMERVGTYRVTISKDIVTGVRDGLQKAFETEVGVVPAQVHAFESAMSRAIYLHPSKIDSTRKVRSLLSGMLGEIRREFELPIFYTSGYKTPEECIEAFEAFVLTQLPGEANISKRSEIHDKLLAKFSELRAFADGQHSAYRAFYETHSSILSPNTIETYVRSILPLEDGLPIRESQERVLAILVAHGFLEVLGEIRDGCFKYSPRAMVETYLTSKGVPSTIILGCGHSGADEMLEFFGLSRESWCGCCKDLPHAGEMVVSLHEPTSDVLCDLNHSDLWAPLPSASIDAIRDETWCLGCYKSETLDSIARVLKVGGEFSSNGYNSSFGIRSHMESRGFEVIVEDLEKNILRMRKAR